MSGMNDTGYLSCPNGCSGEDCAGCLGVPPLTTLADCGGCDGAGHRPAFDDQGRRVEMCCDLCGGLGRVAVQGL